MCICVYRIGMYFYVFMLKLTVLERIQTCPVCNSARHMSVVIHIYTNHGLYLVR